GNDYYALRRHADALEVYEQTVALRKAKLGPDHPDTLRSMNNLANSYHALGRYADALKLREQTLALRKPKLGPHHPDTLLTLGNVAESLITVGRGPEGVAVLDDCIRRATGKVVNPCLLPALLAVRLLYFQTTRDATGCRQTAEQWEKLNRADP